SQQILVLRGKIAQLRRPEMDEKDPQAFRRTKNREAIQLYEQARDEMENMSAVALRQNVLQYTKLLARLARTYDLDGQSGAAEESLSKAVERLRLIFSRSERSLLINPPIMLFLADLQLKNQHVSEAQRTIDELVDQLSESPEESDEQQAKWLGEALKRRVQQFGLQGKLQDALATAQYLEEYYPELAEWALAQQVGILRAEPDSDSTEIEAVLKRWMALRPDSLAPVSLLAELYVGLGQREKAEALREKAIAENPQWEQVLSRVIASVQVTDWEEARKILREQVKIPTIRC
ncbi:unnamed protein product, partial [marine sediment metagenome]